MVNTALITGTAGLIGSHLAEALAAAGAPVVATFYRPTIDIADIESKFDLIEVDVRSYPQVRDIIEFHCPQVIFHLAAQSLPAVSWQKPWETLDTNITGTVNVFEAIKEIRRRQSDYSPTVIVACSSAEYGASLTPERVPITEDAPLLPLHPYGVSKVAQDLLTFQYVVNDRIKAVRARIFNCTGPRKRNDVVSDFARGLALAVTAGQPLKVGNLETRRAILDVRDLVSALIALSQHGRPGEVYNICADRVYKIGDILSLFMNIIGLEIEWSVDPERLRPSDEPIIAGSTEKLKAETGWLPRIDIRETLTAVWEYELDRLRRLKG